MTVSCDVLVVGGGIVGLWVAKRALDAGLSVVLVDKAACGNGASSTVLGALIPHLPIAMNAKKRFQFDALVELPDLITALEDESGGATGYRQRGRIMPIRNEGFHKHIDLCLADVATNWANSRASLRFEIQPSDHFADWLDPDIAPMGVLYETLGASVRAADYVKTLRTAIAKRGRIIEGFEFAAYDRETKIARSATGDRIAANRIVLSAGYHTYDLTKRLHGIDLGVGVKGHAALFKANVPPGAPVIFDGGVYALPRGDGTIAVGTTTENDWSDESQTDATAAAEFIARARGLCLPLRSGRLLKLWAGVRPKNHAKEPCVGDLTNRGELFIATGGYKVSFGIAHRLASVLMDRILDRAPTTALPPTYEVDYHREQGIAAGRWPV